jgi:NTE family protein
MTNVAIALQGGGSHTAFTAGVLDEVLPWLADHDCDLVGLSGTSGGAMTAVAAWNGYLDGGPRGACERLREIWADVVVTGPAERAINAWLVKLIELNNAGAPVPGLSPYQVPWADLGRRQFRRVLERHVDFDRFPALAAEPDAPELVIGTVDVEAGDFETFTDGEVTSEAVLASAAIPTLFEAVEIHGHAHWDGLFSQNPPINDLLAVDVERKPDELWIVQINPQTTDDVPRSLGDINDRRQELSGNLSLNQEVRFVERVNDWIADGELSDQYKHVEVRKIVLDRAFGFGSKFERSPDFVDELMAEGRETADALVDAIEADLHGHEYH